MTGVVAIALAGAASVAIVGIVVLVVALLVLAAGPDEEPVRVEDTRPVWPEEL